MAFVASIVVCVLIPAAASLLLGAATEALAIQEPFACVMRRHVHGHVIAANGEFPDYVFATHVLPRVR